MDNQKNAEKYRKKVNMCLIDRNRAFNCVDHVKLWDVLREIDARLIVLMKNILIDLIKELDMDACCYYKYST